MGILYAVIISSGLHLKATGRSRLVLNLFPSWLTTTSSSTDRGFIVGGASVG